MPNNQTAPIIDERAVLADVLQAIRRLRHGYVQDGPSLVDCSCLCPR